jgi:antitoxin ParD1/3/4
LAKEIGRYLHNMTGRTASNISLTPHLKRFVAARVASGRYQSASEVIREGLRLLEEHEAGKLAVGGLRKEIAIGLQQARSGQLLDGEEVFRELARRRQKRRA